jgi:hypothetical protein
MVVKSYLRFPVRLIRRKPLNDLTWRTLSRSAIPCKHSLSNCQPRYNCNNEWRRRQFKTSLASMILFFATCHSLPKGSLDAIKVKFSPVPEKTNSTKLSCGIRPEAVLRPNPRTRCAMSKTRLKIVVYRGAAPLTSIQPGPLPLE